MRRSGPSRETAVEKPPHHEETLLGMTDGGVTKELVDLVLSIDEDAVSDDVLELAQAVLVDGIAVTIAGATEPSGLAQIIIQWVKESGGAEAAGAVGSKSRVPTANAAFANGTLAHALDFDNYAHPRNHPTSPVLPALLALGQKHSVTGRRLLVALVIAYEVQNRLRLASLGLDPGQGFHKPGTTGLMGGTAACGWLIGLQHEQLRMALGIAGSRVGSLSVNTGTMTKSSHSGHAARMAVESVELADLGWTANPRVFDEGGFFDTLLGDRQDPSLLLQDFGSPWFLADPGVGFKKYPCQGWQQRPIDAVIDSRAENGWAAEDVDSIIVDIPDFGFIDRPLPQSGLDGKFSVQYTVSAAALDGNVTIDTFTDKRRFSSDMMDFLPRVRLVRDPSIPMSSVETYVRLRVLLNDGQELVSVKKEHTGMVGIPLTPEQLETKFMSCALRLMGPAHASRVRSALDEFPNAQGVDQLMDLITWPELN